MSRRPKHKSILAFIAAFAMCLVGRKELDRSANRGLLCSHGLLLKKTFWRVTNLHIAALPIQRHTGEVMFSMISLLLDVLCPEWRTKLLIVTSDGARNMTGRNVGVVTRLNSALPEGCVLIRIWCGCHQLDLLIQFVVDTVVKDNFCSVMTSFVSHLGR